MTATQSVQKALRLLLAYADLGPGASVADFVSATGFNKSTVHRLLNDLVYAEFLERDADSGRYRLGASGRSVAAAAAREQNLAQVVMPVITRTAIASGETVDVDVLDGDHNVIVAQAPGRRNIQVQSQVGQRNPAHCTSTGKVLLAHRPMDELRRVLPETLPALTPRTITDRGVLESELENIRLQGYAVNLEEVEAGMVAVGVPIYDASATVVAALSIGGPIYRLRPEALGSYIKQAREAAEDISERMGAPGRTAASV